MSLKKMIRRLTPALWERDRQKRLLHTVSGVAALLLSSDGEKFENSLRKGLELMARCMDVDRIYIWQNIMKDGALHYIQTFEWLSDAGQQGNPVRSQTGFSYSDSIPEWEAKFLKGECVNDSLNSLSKTERERLQPFGIQSILAIPVYLQERFWGFVSFDDCRRERTFTEDEVGILRSGSLMISSAMNRNETAARIREADERARLMLDATPLSCSLWDGNFNLIDCNEKAVCFYALKDKREYLDRFFELSPEYQPDGCLSTEKAREYIATAFCDGRIVVEWMHQMPNGEPVPTEVTLVRIKRENEYIVAGYTRDLRESRKMAREIERKDMLLRMVNDVASILLESEIDEFEDDLKRCMSMMAECVDADHMYIYKNYKKDGQTYCNQLYKWPGGADLPQDGEIVENIPDSKRVPGWKEKLSNGQCINTRVCDIPPENQAWLSSRGILSILVMPVFLRDQFWGFVSFDDCRRERVLPADELSILHSGSLLIANALLRNKMTLDIRAAVAEAREASHAKSNFLSNMSHEIRTPMSAITGMTMIGKKAADTEGKDYAFGKIEDASNHLLGVINDILDMSKIEANKFELSEVEFNFEKMLQKVVNVTVFRIDEKKQHFTVHLDKDIPQTLIGDDQRLAQVITNLLSNAVKFTPERGTIRLDTHLVKEENGVCTIQIEVKDTGIGISAEQQARLFRSFEQAENNTTRKYGGTGLGLAISKHVVELMGGQIWVESGLDMGSTFAFTVRVRRGAEKEHSLFSPSINRKNLRVLVVDDERETREYFAGIAERFRITCDTAGSGEEALKLIDNKSSYNLYFVDWNMPGMNGIKLSRKIKERDTDRSIIIMISATEWNEIEEDAKAAGVDKFLSKPLFPSTIADCINECIDVEDSLAAAEAQPVEKTEHFQGHCILLAEDLEINREIVTAMLEPTRLEIDCAENGAEAMRMFSAAPERYDIIFMDVQMPKMDGLEATQRIRALGFPKAEKIPIVAMTANVFREDIEKCIQAGMNDHLGKPMDTEELMSKLAKYLNEKPVDEERG